MTLFLLFLLITFPIISNGFPWFHKKSQPNIYCGVSDYDNRLTDRVVGGREVKPGEVPFYVSIEELIPSALSNELSPTNPANEFKYKCSGVLISNRWVLTTAHCSTIGWFGTFRVVLGKKTIAVEKQYPHPDFSRRSIENVYSGLNPMTLKNDIALLLLKEPVEFNKYIQPICLPEPGEDETFYGLNGTTAGWDKIDPVSIKPTKLQVTTLPIIKYDDCQRFYSKAGYNTKSITESVLCDSHLEGEKKKCFVGSGSPLMVNTKGHWILFGISLNGISCAKPELPGIYTRVSYCLDWIKKTIHEEEHKKDKQ